MPRMPRMSFRTPACVPFAASTGSPAAMLGVLLTITRTRVPRGWARTAGAMVGVDDLEEVERKELDRGLPMEGRETPKRR